jgi:ribose 5-phosphate isomerase B
LPTWQLRLTKCPASELPYHDVYSAERSRKSNDCQIIGPGRRVVDEELAKTLVDAWLASNYQGGRSASKVERMKQIDQQFYQPATSK